MTHRRESCGTAHPPVLKRMTEDELAQIERLADFGEWWEEEAGQGCVYAHTKTGARRMLEPHGPIRPQDATDIVRTRSRMLHLVAEVRALQSEQRALSARPTVAWYWYDRKTFGCLRTKEGVDVAGAHEGNIGWYWWAARPGQGSHVNIGPMPQDMAIKCATAATQLWADVE